jgi:hypothetical protein
MSANKRAETSVRDAWVKIFKPEPRARLRLFCFSYAGEARKTFTPGRESFRFDRIMRRPVAGERWPDGRASFHQRAGAG